MSEEVSGQMYWHIHHEVLAEPLTEPVEARIAFINNVKAQNETPEEVALRLRLIKPIKGELPTKLTSAIAAMNELNKEWTAACAVSDEAWRALNTNEGLRLSDKDRKPLVEASRKATDAERETYMRVREGREAYEEAMRGVDLKSLHEAECPGCPWDGRTIFSEAFAASLVAAKALDAPATPAKKSKSKKGTK